MNISLSRKIVEIACGDAPEAISMRTSPRRNRISPGSGASYRRRRDNAASMPPKREAPRQGRAKDRRDRRLQAEPADAVACRLRQAGRAVAISSKALSPRFGLSISWSGKRNFVGRDWRAISAAECGRTAKFGSRAATRLTNRPELRGFLPARKPRRRRNRTDARPISDGRGGGDWSTPRPSLSRP